MVPRCLISSTRPAAPARCVAPRRVALATTAARISHRPCRRIVLSPLRVKVLCTLVGVLPRRLSACLLPGFAWSPSISACLDPFQAADAGTRDQREDQVQT